MTNAATKILAAFADRYRHAFPDLVITTTADGEDLRLEWQESPSSPCYTVTIRRTHYGPAVVVETGVFVVTDGDILNTLVYVMARERGRTMLYGVPVFAAPGSFGALILEHAMTRGLPIRPQSPDQLN